MSHCWKCWKMHNKHSALHERRKESYVVNEIIEFMMTLISTGSKITQDDRGVFIDRDVYLLFYQTHSFDTQKQDFHLSLVSWKNCSQRIEDFNEYSQ